MRKLLLSFVVALAGTALTASLQDARSLYAKGDYLKAASTALSLNTSDGAAFAARATSIYAMTRPEREQEPLYSRAEEYARKAIALDERDADGYFELARALGRLAQLRGILAALTQGLGNQVKDDLDQALTLNPKHAGAMIGLAVWHAEIWAKHVGWLYGADPDKAVTLLEAAVKIEPNFIAHRIEYARALMLLDQNKYRARAKAQLEIALRLKPNDATERFDLERARKMLAELVQ